MKRNKLPTIEEIDVKKCTLCKHFYMKPCNGKQNDCPNAVFVRSGGKIDIGRMSIAERERFRKSKKQVPDVEPNVGRPKRKRVKL